MIIDTSAIVAMLLDEPERDRLIDAIVAAERGRMSAATFVKCAVVVDGEALCPPLPTD